MKACLTLLRFAVCQAMRLLSSKAMLACVVTVDCSGATPGAFTNFASALASLTPTVPNTINVMEGKFAGEGLQNHRRRR